MKEHPILCSGELVRAILDGRKTVTRRPVRLPAGYDHGEVWAATDQYDGRWALSCDPGPGLIIRCPFGLAGDRLWVRETWGHDSESLAAARARHEDVMGGPAVYYRADRVHEESGLRWRPSIHMPWWASRLTLEVHEVRVEPLQAITEEEARAEGVAPSETTDGHPSHVQGFIDAWERIYGDGAWERNDWVWAVSFRRLEAGRVAA